ncbi:MAG: hypothetical protein EAZ88_22515 [Oscillatoriales cyanobacterium]|nr:MAG: hypothetical protein EAZ88_22515 [Oscillatoriales cyanobacterium]
MKINIANLSPLAQPPQQTFLQIRPKPLPVRAEPELSSPGRTPRSETGFLPIFLVTQPKFFVETRFRVYLDC